MIKVRHNLAYQQGHCHKSCALVKQNVKKCENFQKLLKTLKNSKTFKNLQKLAKSLKNSQTLENSQKISKNL